MVGVGASVTAVAVGAAGTMVAVRAAAGATPAEQPLSVSMAVQIMHLANARLAQDVIDRSIVDSAPLGREWLS